MEHVAKSFVPVAVNADRLPDTAGGRLVRALMKRWPQGLWVVSPAGETLGFHYHQPKPGEGYARNQQRWADDTLAMLKQAGDFPPRTFQKSDPFPDRGRGRTDGGVRLAVTVTGNGPPAVDSVLLDADDFATLVKPGVNEWAVPERVAKRFAPALTSRTDSIFVARPADLTTAPVTAKVVRKDGDQFVVRYRGEWASLHHRDGDPKFPIRCTATGEGVGVYAPGRGLVSLVWVLRGTAENSPTAAVVEWEDTSGDR